MFEGGSKPPPPLDNIDPYGMFDERRIVRLSDPKLVLERAAELRELGYDDTYNLAGVIR